MCHILMTQTDADAQIGQPDAPKDKFHYFKIFLLKNNFSIICNTETGTLIAQPIKLHRNLFSCLTPTLSVALLS